MSDSDAFAHLRKKSLFKRFRFACYQLWLDVCHWRDERM